MRSGRVSSAAGSLAVAASLALPGLAAAAKTTVFKGKTSQGKAITVKYVRPGHGKGVIEYETTVVGNCPVQGLGTSATLAQDI